MKSVFITAALVIAAGVTCHVLAEEAATAPAMANKEVMKKAFKPDDALVKTVQAGKELVKGNGIGRIKNRPERAMSAPARRRKTACSDKNLSRGLRTSSNHLTTCLAAFSRLVKNRGGSSRFRSTCGSQGFCPNARRPPITDTINPNGIENPGSGIGVTKGSVTRISSR